MRRQPVFFAEVFKTRDNRERLSGAVGKSRHGARQGRRARENRECKRKPHEGRKTRGPLGVHDFGGFVILIAKG
jgi:hypothetical protein